MEETTSLFLASFQTRMEADAYCLALHHRFPSMRMEIVQSKDIYSSTGFYWEVFEIVPTHTLSRRSNS